SIRAPVAAPKRIDWSVTFADACALTVTWSRPAPARTAAMPTLGRGVHTGAGVGDAAGVGETVGDGDTVGIAAAVGVRGLVGVAVRVAGVPVGVLVAGVPVGVLVDDESGVALGVGDRGVGVALPRHGTR